ncbi:hypothetical protein HDV04_001009 [Boothiomyces sp. JEL0838]|nr:hypothetical protein HDV04_001009 [Boothiomyces sp. JEL0838]
MPYVNIDNAPITKGSLLHKLSMTFEGTHNHTYFHDSYAMPNIYQKQTIKRVQDGPYIQIEVQEGKPARKERSGPFVQLGTAEQEKLLKKTNKKKSFSYTEKLVQIDMEISSGGKKVLKDQMYSPSSEPQYLPYTDWKREMKRTDRYFIISELATLIANQLPNVYTNVEQASKDIEHSVYESSRSRQEYCTRIREQILAIRRGEIPRNKEVEVVLGHLRELQKYLAGNGLKQEFLKLADIEYAIKNRN